MRSFAVLCVSVGVLSVGSLAQANEGNSFYLTKAIESPVASQMIEILHSNGIRSSIDTGSVLTSASAISCRAPVTLNPIAHCKITTKTASVDVPAEQSIVLHKILLKEGGGVKTSRLGVALTAASNMICRQTSSLKLCTFEVEVPGTTAPLASEEINAMRAIFKRAGVKSSGVSVYGSTTTATLRETIFPAGQPTVVLPEWTLVFAGKEVKLNADEVQFVTQMFGRVGVARQTLADGSVVSEAVIRYASIMCRPPMWTISFKASSEAL